MKRILFTAVMFAAVALFSTIFAGCISSEKEPQGANLTYGATASIGAGENQTQQLQRFNWGVNLTNTGDREAMSANASMALHPEIVSRLNDSSLSLVVLGNIPPGSTIGLNGMAVFNATGLSKQDIAGWKPLVSVKLEWVEDGSGKEQVIEMD